LGMLTHRILKLIKKYKHFTKEDLMLALGMNKSTIDAIINELLQLGYISKIDKGLYRYESHNDLSQLDEFLSKLNTRIHFSSLYFYTVSSTQLIARDLSESNCPEGTIVIAEIQTKGRGRHNRSWFSPIGGIWMTIILRPNFPPSIIPLMNLIVGLAVAKAINNEYNVQALVKWPNDVMINDKKVCGILIECSLKGNLIDYLLVGIGINANNSIPPGIDGISLKDVLGKPILRIPLIMNLCKILDHYYSLLVDHNAHELPRVLNELKLLSHTLGKEVLIVLDSGKQIRGKATDINFSGNLIISINGKRLEVAYHEVKKLIYL